MSLHEETNPISFSQETSAIAIGDLPNEIVSQIFTAGTENWRDLRPLDLPFPVLISAVCRHWRLLARSIGGLWRFIVVPLHKEDADCLQWISDWMDLSFNLPLSVVLDDKIRRPRRSAEATNRLESEAFALLMRSVIQLRRLDISIDAIETIESSLNCLQDAQRLQQLSLCFRGPPFATTFLTGSGWFPGNLPHLTKLRIQNVILLNPRNLTSLVLHKPRLGYEETKALFLGSPQLTNLILHNLLPLHTPIPSECPEIHANSLHSLAIHSHGIDERGAVYFLSFLRISNLSYLEVDGNTRIASILGRSTASSNIQKLRISNCSKFFFISHPIESRRDINFYHSLSTLQRLELVHAPLHGLIPKSSAASRNPASSSETSKSESSHFMSSDVPWPGLRKIYLDTVFAVDVAHLVNILKSHKHVKSIELSATAAHHLCQSMTKKNGEDTMPDVFPAFLDLEENTLGEAISEGVHGAVEVDRVQSYNYGLLDGDRASLWQELP